MRIGIYRHNKTGNLYLLLYVGLHTETGEPMAIYRKWNDPHVTDVYVRPLHMFNEMVEINGKKVPRFEWYGSEPHQVS